MAAPSRTAVLIYEAVRRLQPNAYGVTIRRHLWDEHRRDVSYGTIYAEADELEKGGWLRSEEGEATLERGGRPKRLFFTTGTPLPSDAPVSDVGDGFAFA